MRIKLLVALFFVLVLSLGCFVAPPATTGAASGTKYDATQDSRIAVLEGIIVGPNGLQTIVSTMNTKVAGLSGGDTSGLNSRVSSVETRLATAEGKLASVSSGASTATTDELAKRIKALEEWKGGLGTGSGTGSGSSSVPVTGQVTYNTYKAPDLIYTPGSFVWYLEIMNGTTEYKKIYVSSILNTVDTHLADIDKTTCKFNSPDLVGGISDTTGAFSMNFVPTSGVDATMISGMSTGYVIIKGGEKKLVAILLNLAYVGADVSRWEAVWSINAQKYP